MNPIDFTCPSCGAPPGIDCNIPTNFTTLNGAPIFHTSRPDPANWS